jgi:5-methyltetrahydropteroyltriglutamate--homocysteine methyltransferase
VKRSTDRFLTTHVGSLVRTREIIEGMKALDMGQPYDEAKLAADVRAGVAEVVRKQAEIGIDIPSDGEYRGRSFSRHFRERFDGLEVRPLEPGEDVWGAATDLEQQKFPAFFEQYHAHFRYLWMLPEVDISDMPNLPGNHERFRLTGPITYKGHAAMQRDMDNFRAAIDALPAGLEVADAFTSALTPMTRYAGSDRNILDFYPSEEAYLYAYADELREEYRAIVDAGFLVQVDLGILNPRRQMLVNDPNPDAVAIRKAIERSIEIVNYSLRDIPEEKIRYHHCWGSMNSPHTQDTPLRELVQYLLRVKAGAYVIEAANPRHEHEWMVWKDVKLPDGKILIPGLISHQTNVVEHPELVAWRLENFASVVGKENLIASTDCGFSQYWDMIRVHPTVQWAKLEALVEGARLASKKLWGR